MLGGDNEDGGGWDVGDDDLELPPDLDVGPATGERNSFFLSTSPDLFAGHSFYQIVLYFLREVGPPWN